VSTPLPLSPAGTVAARFGSSDRDELFRHLGIGAARCDLGDQGLYLAEEIVRADRWLGPPEREALAFLVLATTVAARQGATRIPLDARGPLGPLMTDIARAAGRGVPKDLVKRIRDLTTAGHFAASIGGPDHGRPLIVDQGCIYPQRLHWLERRVARAVAARLAPGPSAAPSTAEAAVADAVADIVGRPSDVRLSDEQTAAVGAACAARLAVISGGPGTGKTQIAVAVVRALARLGLDPARIALAAPTGKAANRLAASFRRQLAAVVDPSSIDARLAAAPPPAQTLHRLLGYRPRDDSFRHHQHNRLMVDAVLVDEASMIDLGLVERLLQALPDGARLILIGDARQLPSVDAGQVLADLVDIAARQRAPWAARLEKSFRMDQGDAGGRAVLEAARAIDAGEPQRWSKDRLAATRGGATHLAWTGVERIAAGGAAVGEVVDAWWRRATDGEFWALAHRAYHRSAGGWAPADADALGRLLALHERSRLLTATRSQPTGSVALGQRLHRHMLDRSSADREPDFLPGEPVMMTGNDYERGLYNGDPGIIVRVSDDGGAQRFRAVFRRDGELVPFPLDAVRQGLELAWAITVHKSQGSEWDHVVVVLPDDDLPILTRELVYTALTRARSGAVVVGAPAVLDAAARRRAARHSGLAERVLAEVAPR
jgi:exodeoxyribonuclease V alpha subunit